jgi:hypothetical protein
VASVAFQDIGTANKAASLLEKIALTKPGQDAFFGATCSTMLRQLLQV